VYDRLSLPGREINMSLRQIQVSDSLEDIARIGVVFFRQVSSAPTSVAFSERVEALTAELRRTLAGRPLSELESVQRTRRLYHLVGVDPTKDRPSSERLLKRVIQSQPFPRVNQLVDAINLASLSLQCPLGVYDWDKVLPPVLVRIGRPEDCYIGVDGTRVGLEGKLALVDGEGFFGNPSHDSHRTQVTQGTVRALVVAWAPAEAPRSHLEGVLKEVIELGREFCDARVDEWGILG
jgi:DNA/RNA-binding domain of Phe-tRNA-synthetase-like protein